MHNALHDTSQNQDAAATSAPGTEQCTEQDVTTMMQTIGTRARDAARILATTPTETKNKALTVAAEALRANADKIMAANAKDIDLATGAGKPAAFIDRLRLTPERIDAMASGVEAIADLPDPVGETIASWTRPNGLVINRVRTPLGVIGIIYESRPNVTADAGALCLKSGNAAILRGGSDSLHSSLAIRDCMSAGLADAELPEASIQVVATTDRAAVGAMLTGLGNTIDVIVPRGGKSLVARVQSDARVPVFSHLEGICHIYVDKHANMAKAIEIIVNAKMRRTGVCGAAETLLIDAALPDADKTRLITALQQAGCEVRATPELAALADNVVPVKPEDWDTEYLDAIISAKCVNGVTEAIAHIAQHSTSHTEAILTEDEKTANRFTTEVDSAIVLVNASTQFADGGEFGMGAEIGIATGKMHARGPVGVEQLTSFKYVVQGSGQTRPA